MPGLVVFSCHCLNIRIHTSTRYSLDTIDSDKKEAFVSEPFPGWKYELGMGGIVTEFSTLTYSQSADPKWTTVGCLNCNTHHVYSVEAIQTVANHVIVHESAVCGSAYERLKQDNDYSKTFSIKLNDSNQQDTLISMPESEEDVPEKLMDTHRQIQSTLDQQLEQLRIESKVRIEKFKKEEEKQLQEAIARVKTENNQLWTKIVRTTKPKEIKTESATLPVLPSSSAQQQHKPTNTNNHVRFAEQPDETLEAPAPVKKRLSFSLDESAIGSLRDKNLDSSTGLKKYINNPQGDSEEEEEEEDMFNLDEEFSDEEEKPQENDEQVEEDNDESKQAGSSDDEEVQNQNKDLLLSASLKQSISWIKRKRNTSKYLAKDFDIKSDFKRRDSTATEQDSTVSMYATSMPITIQYPLQEEDKEDDSEQNDNTTISRTFVTTRGTTIEGYITSVDPALQRSSQGIKTQPRKQEMLPSSFSNYDSSFSDRMLSEQFSLSNSSANRRRSLASTSHLRPQLDSLIGKSLDTRGLLKKKANKIESNNNSDDEFDASVPPHVWAAVHEPNNE